MDGGNGVGVGGCTQRMALSEKVCVWIRLIFSSLFGTHSPWVAVTPVLACSESKLHEWELECLHMCGCSYALYLTGSMLLCMCDCMCMFKTGSAWKALSTSHLGNDLNKSSHVSSAPRWRSCCRAFLSSSLDCWAGGGGAGSEGGCMRTECVLVTDWFSVVKMCIHKMRRAGRFRQDEKAAQIDLDGMSWWEKWILAIFFYLSPRSSNGRCYTFNSWSHSYWCYWTLKWCMSQDVLWLTHIFSSNFYSTFSPHCSLTNCAVNVLKVLFIHLIGASFCKNFNNCKYNS